MDLVSIIAPLLGKFWIFILIAFLLLLLRTRWFKGIIGEATVNFGVKLFLDKEVYHLIKNVTFPTEDGTTQIDHVIVSPYGIFLIETKNMKGWIFGSSHQKTWTQKIYRESFKFQNPIHQNYKHVKTLQSFLKLNDSQVHSLVVFVGDSTFKTEMPENVTYPRGGLQFIKNKTEVVFSETEVRDIVNKIEAGRLSPSFKTSRAHVKHVKDIINEKQNANTCPKCGGPMILRETKKGPHAGKQFYGCSRFPNCRGITAIS